MLQHFAEQKSVPVLGIYRHPASSEMLRSVTMLAHHRALHFRPSPGMQSEYPTICTPADVCRTCIASNSPSSPKYERNASASRESRSSGFAVFWQVSQQKSWPLSRWIQPIGRFTPLSTWFSQSGLSQHVNQITSSFSSSDDEPS